MILEQERRLIVKYGLQLVGRGLTRGTGGNLSVYNRQEGLVAISPSALDYDQTTAEDVTVMAIDGRVVDGAGKPSSELEMHLIFYQKRDDIAAVVHTHSIFATTLACLRKEIPPVHYLIGFAGIKVPCASYATNTGKALALNAFEAMAAGKAVLLANHGLLAIGKDLAEAFNVAEITEYCAEIYYRACCIGEPVSLSREELDEVMETFKTYGKSPTKNRGDE